MRDDQPLARIIPFPNLPPLPEIELPVWLEHAERIHQENRDTLVVRSIAQWLSLITGLFGLLVDVGGRLISEVIASWPLLVLWWALPALGALILWFILHRKLAAVTVQFGGLTKLQELHQFYRAILRYGDLRARYQQRFSRSEDERREGLWPAYKSLADYCLLLAEKGQPFDSHLRLAEGYLDEAEMAMW